MAQPWPSKFFHPAQKIMKSQASDPESPESLKEPVEPSGPRLTAEVEDIVAAIDIHSHFRRPGSSTDPDAPKAIDWLPLLDPVDLYDIDDTARRKLARIEAARLHQALKAGSKLLRFNMGKPLGMADSDGYAKLDAAGWKLMWCFIVCDHDVEITLFEHLPRFYDEERMEGIKDALQNRLNRETTKILEDNEELCWALVDYVTAVVGLMIINESEKAEWQARCLADLARWSMKVKVLCRNLKEYTERTLELSRNILRMEKVKQKGLLSAFHTLNLKGLGITRKDLAAEPPIAQRQSRFGPILNSEPRQQKFDTNVDRLEVAYGLELVGTRRQLDEILLFIFSLFVSSEKNGLSSHSFEISFLARQLGLHTTTMTCLQDRDGELVFSASHRITWGSRKMWAHLLDVAGAVREKSEWVLSNTDTAAASAPGTVAVFCESDTIGWVGPFKTASLDAIITLLVPLGCSSPYTVANIVELGRIFNAVWTRSDFLRPTPVVNFSALFSMRTVSFASEMKEIAKAGNVAPGTDPEADKAVPDTQALSTSLMSRNGLEYLQMCTSSNEQIDQKIQQGDRDLDWSPKRRSIWRRRPWAPRKHDLRSEIDRMRGLNEEIEQNWTIDETSVTISCARYVLQVALACVILVLGGIAVGFTVEDRIKGVDPFNITVFCWAFAAFILVVAKAYRVQDWPWRDYLRRRVVCRSISELCDVTGKDPQLVLQYLLWNEPSTTLISRGPYNKLFGRQDKSGFSIDVKMQLRTLFAAGIIVVKVVSPHGYALVCRRLRKGDTLVVTQVYTTDNKEEGKDWTWACIEPLVASSKPGQDVHLVQLRLDWNRILGLYNVPRREFC